MTRTLLLTAATIALLATPARAEDITVQSDDGFQTSFSQAIKSIKGWFGADTPDQVEPASGDMSTAATDDDLQVPPSVSPDLIEPAAGAMGEDDLQVPPPYFGPQSNATPRASSFDNNPAIAAFGAKEKSAADLANIESAAGEDSQLDRGKMDCDAILKAADSAEEGDIPDTALIEACEVPLDGEAATPASETPLVPAQPGFEIEPMPEPLPATQPAAGEPPIGGAVMPGEAAPAMPATLQ